MVDMCLREAENADTVRHFGHQVKVAYNLLDSNHGEEGNNNHVLTDDHRKNKMRPALSHQNATIYPYQWT